jgi:very-short-patch-repair endonuclease
MISFVNSVCGCEKEYKLKVLALRTDYEVCKQCKPKYVREHSETHTCRRCGASVLGDEAHAEHEKRCSSKFADLEEGVDYVICAVCGYHGKSLGKHVVDKHGLGPVEYKRKHQIICSRSSETYAKQNVMNGEEWRERISERGDDAIRYLEKMGSAVREAILNNPEDRKRRAKVMAEVNRSDVMRRKSSETAIKTSARKGIQEKRAAQLKRWRDNNPDDFYNQCTSKMLRPVWHSKPERLLFELVSVRTDYQFKRNQVVKSERFPTKSKRRQVDFGDKAKRVYVEFDGPLHFKQTKLKQLDRVQEKDRLLDEHIARHGWTLIRVSCDQFSYRKSDYGFKKSCIDKVFALLDNPLTGVHYIGRAYER